MNPMWVIVLVLALTIAWEGIVNDSTNLIRFFDWLEGSRKTYYIGPDGFVACSSKKLRTPIDRVGTDMANRIHGVIEISHGLFRPSSAIYGDYHIAFWKITNDDQKDQAGVFVDLKEERGLPVEKALQLINTYPSLQAMLYRINQLEGQLKVSDKQLKNKSAAIKAALQLINADRNQYRSKTSERIRKWLELADHSADPAEIWPSTDLIQDWSGRFLTITKD